MERKMPYNVLILLGMLFLGPVSFSQEDQRMAVEESAEVFLEEYSDQFQVSFFEGLKQKGIQNYDRAINALLECKQIQPDNAVVCHELAKAHFLDKSYVQGENYAIEALTQNPENYWYLHTLVDILAAQNVHIDAVQQRIPISNTQLLKNLVDIYFRKGNYKSAQELLKKLDKTQDLAYLQQRINDSLAAKNAMAKDAHETVINKDTYSNSALEQYRLQLESLLENSTRLDELLKISGEALDHYPSQPFFYYAHGVALVRQGKHQEAVEILEAGLDYFVDDVPLANKIYKQLADSHKMLGNANKSVKYLEKVKTSN